MATSHSSSNQGQVKDPEHDGRLKENRESGTSKGSSHESHSSGHQGQVKDPEHDGRLKENRESGTSKGSTHR
jgi:hypothetical protein